MELGCENCYYGQCRKVGPRGNIEADFVVVGESPGTQELRHGLPFSGPSGDVLFSYLPKPEEMDMYITNALQCRPKGDKHATLPKATETCNDRLIAEITKHPRKVILALGNAALWSLTGDYSLRITQCRGQVFQSPYAELGIVASTHPAFLLHGGGSYKKFQEDIQLALDLYNGKQTKSYIEPEYKVYRTLEEIDEFLALVERDKPEFIAGDTETSGLSAQKDYFLSLGFSWDPKMVHIIRGEDEVLITEEVDRKKSGKKVTVTEEIGVKRVINRGSAHWAKLQPLLEDPRYKYIWHNGKFDVRFFRAHGVNARIDVDTLLLNYSLDETRGVHSLDMIGMDLLGTPDWKSELDKHFPRKGASYAHVPDDILDLYLARDCSVMLQAFFILRYKVDNDEKSKLLYEKTLLPASTFLLGVEENGFFFDWEMWEKNKEDLSTQIKLLGEEIDEIAGYAINPGSSQQMCTLLFDELNIPTKVRSTDKKVVAKLPRVPATIKLTEWRKASKEYNTYVIGLTQNIHPDGKVHPDFMLHGTVTGRLACKDPNMQNIPRKKYMRGMFRAEPGKILIDADYSQAELRCLAELSGDEVLIDIYLNNRSLHKEMAIHLFGEDYDEEEYVRTKSLNFGIVYGIEAYSIAETFGITYSEAQAMINGWYKKFEVAGKFIERCRKAPIKGQNLVTDFGRRKRAGIVSRENLKHTQNEFANFPHQSTASDLTLHSAMKAAPQIKEYGAQIVNLVHDSIIAQVDNNPESIAAVSSILKREMEATPLEWGLDTVPFEADFKLAINWGNPLEH